MSASEEVAAVGDTQRFECQVVGYPSPNVTWYKDEVDITNNPRYNIHYDKDRGVIALTIRQVLPTDEGCYQCRAQNSEGYATTTAYLVVKVEHGLSRGFRSMLVSEKATEQEMSQVQMASADKQRVFEEVITRVEETEKEVIEEKLFPPKLTYDRALGDGVQLKSGSTLYIEVGVSGIPFPDVTWHHGDARLREDARLTMETESGYAYLKLKGTTQEDAGTYKVTAENTVGKDEATFSVTVKAPPSPPRNLRVIEVYKDYITIAWDKPEHDNGFPITGYIIEKSLSGGMFVSVNQVLASEFEYKITRLYEGSEYKFRVMAENKIGVSVPATMEQPVKARLPFDPPGKPRGLAVTSVDKDAVGLRWEAPETDGGALITSYIVEKKDVSRTSSMWAIAGTVEGTKFEFLVPKLFTGNCYHFRVFAENRVGPGEPATLDDGVIAKLPYDKPMPARNIRAIETNVDYIVIEWDEPEHDGGSPITAYIIEKRDAKRREFIYIADVPGDVRSFKATRLFEGYEYFFRVFAENIVGASEPCEMSKAAKAKLPYDEPLEPRNLRVTDYWTDFVSLQWDAPTSDGGSPLTGYVIEKRDALRQTWVKAGNVGPDVDNFKVTNLFEGTEYVFRVFAENKVGPSLKACELDKSVKAKMPFDPPFAPQSLKTSDVNADRITVSWGAPSNDGGSPITRYVVEKRDAMRATWGACGHTEPGTCTLVVEGLIEGDNYFFRVAAENQVGRGEYVELVHPITAKLPYTKPSKPTGLRTTEIWNTYIVLAWDAPKDDGGSPVTGYNIEVRDTMKAGFKFVASVNASTTSFQVTNLEEGHDYYFRVFAENKAGLSDAAAELKPAVKAQLPYNRPGPPSTIKVIGTGKATISITWTVPESDGGSPITGYIIEICPALSTEFSAVATVDASTTSYTIEDLKDGADYFVRVRSQNAAGISKDATQTELPIAARAPKTAPSRPGAVAVKEVMTDSMTVTWKVPETDGGATITAYQVEVREVGGTFFTPVTVDGKTLSATIPGLSPDKAYEVQVSAKNTAGTSEPIMTAEATKTKPKPVEVKPEEVKPAEVKPAEVKPTEVKPAEVKPAEVKPAEVKPVEEKPVQAEPAVKPAETAAPAQLTLPSAPKSLRVTDAQPDAVTIAWEAPESDGGSPVTHYVVVIKDVASSKKYKKAGRVDCNTMSLRITDKIKKGHEYMIAVYAENAAGVSTDGAELATPILVPEEKQAIVEEVIEVVEQATAEAAKPAPAEAVKPAEAPKPTEPAAPVNPHLDQVTSESITISWDAPTNDGGAEVTKYTICVRDAEKKKFKAAGTVDGKTTTYTIDKVKESHEYFIRVYAENEVGISTEGEVTTSIKVPTKKPEDTVDAGKFPAPEIVTAPEPVAVKEGETIRLTCKVKGDPEPEVTWFKGDKKLKQSKREPRLKIQWDMAQDLNILIITDATADDAGEYTVLAENDHGSFRFTVTILVGKTEGMEITKTTESKQTTTVVEETTVDGEVVDRTVKQEVSEDTPEVTVEKTVVTEKPAEVVEVVQEEGAAPKFEKPPEPMLVDLGETINLSCRVTGDPEPEVTWYKEGELIKPSKRDPRIKTHWDFKEDLNFLTIKDAKKEDEGKYTVIADNKFGSFKFSVTVLVGKPAGAEIIKTTESKRSVTVVEETIVDGEVVDRTVKEDISESEPSTVVEKITVEESAPVESAPKEEGKPPKFVQAPEPVFVDFGETVKLTCKVEGTPKPEVQWYKAKSKIETGDRSEVKYSSDDDIHMLIIINATSDDAGEYTVIAENKFGSFKFTVTVLVGRPEGAEIVTKTTESKRSVKVIEETVVDGKVTQRVVQEDVSEDTPTEHIVKEEPILSHEAPSSETVRPSSEAIATEKVIVSQSDKDEVQVEGVITLGEDIDSDKVHKVLQDSKVTEETSTTSETFTIGAEESTKTILTQEATTLQTSSVTEATDTQKVLDDTVIIIEDKGEAPKFIQPPEPVFVDFGETVKLTCKVTGSPTPEVSWYRKGDPDKIVVKDDDHRVKPDFDEKQDLHILIILDAKADDAGDYTVIAENKYGSFKFTVTVLVGKPEGAEIVTKTVESKRSVKVVEETLVDGKVVERTVKEETSEETPDSQTKTEEAVIVSEKTPTDSKVEEASQKKVEESIIVSEDTTEVHATIKDIEITASDAATITATTTEVQKTKESVTSEETQKAVEPEPAVKEVVTVEKAVKTEVKKKPASESEESSSEESSSEEESSEEEPDKAPGKETGKPPKFSQPPEPVFVDIGETIKLTCKVTGDPSPLVSWYKAETLIETKSDSDRVKSEYDAQQDLHILMVMDANLDDAGDYRVIAENKYGRFKFTVTVLVGKTEGAEVVKKTIESKRSVKVVEETVVDGKVVQRTIKEDTSEETPDSQTKVEETLILSEETPTVKTTTSQKGEIKVGEESFAESSVLLSSTDQFAGESSTTDISMEAEAVFVLEEHPQDETQDVVTVKEAASKSEDEAHVEHIIKSETSEMGEEMSSSETFTLYTSTEDTVEGEEIKSAVQEHVDKKAGVVAAGENQPPKFIQTPEPVFVDIGETIKLTCKVSGDPEPKVTWFRGDAELSTSGRITVDQIDGTYTLTITEATEQDAGDYKVRATNTFGTFNFTVTVLVGKPAGSKIVEMTRKTTSVRETIVDGEVVEHLEKEDVQTEKFDETDSQSTTKVETSETKTLKQEVVEDVVTEEKTEKVESVKPKDDKAPKIDIPPEPVSVDEGETIRLTCKVSGDPEPEVCWYKGQDVIKPKKRDTRIQVNWDMSTDLNHLVVSDARLDDGGEYTMKAENKHGECSVTVIVKVGHQVEDKKQESVEEIVVEQVIEKDSVEVSEKEVIKAATEKDEEVSATIKLDAPEEEGAITKLSDVQEVEVSVIDTAKDSTTATAESVTTESVTIKEMTETVTKTEETTQEESQPAGAPKMEIAPKPVIVDVGEKVEITCKFSGDPEPEVNFYKNDKLIKNKKSDKRVQVDWNMKTDIYTLIIENATANDAGDYVIKAENSRGLIQFTVSVSIGKAGVIETSHTTTITEHTIVDGGAMETVVHKETSTESSASGVPTIESTITETVAHEVMETKAPEVKDSPVDDTAKVTEVEEKVTEDVAKVTEVAEKVTKDVAKVTEAATKEVTEVSEVVKSSTETVKVAEKEEKDEEPMSEDSSLDSEASEEDDGAPTIEEAPVPVSVKLGETICLKCKVTGDPEPEVSWLRNDVEIKPKRHDKRVKIDWDMKQNLHILTITDATLEDAGEYAVKAENVNGGFTLKVTVVVSELSEQSTIVTKVETVEASDSTKFETGTSEDLKKSQSTIVETRTSTVVETTESDMVSGKSQMSVGVEGAPVLEEPPEPAAVPVGGTVRLTCRVTGDPDPSLTWYKGHMPLGVDDRDPRIQTTFDTVTKVSTLSIQRASIIDGGKYEVHAENSKGLIIITVDVVVSDEITELIVEDHTSERTVQDDSELVGITIQESSSRRKAGESELSVEEIIARELAGAHSTVSQLRTSKSSQSSLEAGASAPTFELPPEPVSVTEGATIRLTCKVSGHPVPTVTWLRDGLSLDGELWDKRMNIDFMTSSGMHVLAIRECRLSDAGIYTVMAQNNHGSTKHTVSVHVGQSDPELVYDEGDLTGLSFTKGKVSIKTTRFELSGDDDLHLKIGGDLSATGILKDIAGDRAVEGYRQESTGGPGAPVIERPPRPVSVAIGETIRLTCLTTGDPEPDVTWYKAGKQIKPRRLDRRIRVDWDLKTDEQFLEIRNATEDDSGEYEMRAENSKGSTSFTVSVHVGESDLAGATYERRVVQSSSSTSSSSTSGSSLLSDPMFSDLSGSMRFSSRFK